MQVLKDNINHDILEAAKALFLEKGFSNVSMREIADKANVGLSNMYNYFKSKDELFKTIVQPAVSVFGKSLKREEEGIDIAKIESDEFIQRYIDQYLEFVNTCRTELTILLLKSKGSSLQNFKYDFTNEATRMVKKAFERQHCGSKKSSISEFSIHLHTVWKFTLLEEIINHTIEFEELEKVIDEYVRFEIIGWRELINK